MTFYTRVLHDISILRPMSYTGLLYYLLIFVKQSMAGARIIFLRIVNRICSRIHSDARIRPYAIICWYIDKKKT